MDIQQGQDLTQPAVISSYVAYIVSGRGDEAQRALLQLEGVSEVYAFEDLSDQLAILTECADLPSSDVCAKQIQEHALVISLRAVYRNFEELVEEGML